MKFNKIISLFIGAAIISSVVPTTVNAAIKLEALEGTINDAKAFKDGSYVFDGYRGEEDSAMYFFNGKEDTKIEDAETMGSKYGMNYINFKDDEILFNMATGQAEDDEETKVSAMENKFKSSVMKKADRYENTPYLHKVGKIAENIFGGIWYEYVVSDNEDLGKAKEKYTVYLSDSGKYVDASETLNIIYYDKDGNKIKLDTYDDLNKNGLSIAGEVTLLMDAENIYKIILISDTDNNSKPTAYISKISMEQGEKKDGAYIPKSVTSYEAYDLNIENLISGYINGNVTARVIGNNLYIIKTDKDNSNKSITVDRYKFKKVKDKQTFNGEEKVLDKRVVELDDDFDEIKNEDMDDYDIDVQGNVWILNNGKVQKLENNKLETKYIVDRSMDKLSVFAENSMIIWNTGNEIYSVVAPQPVQEEEKTEDSADSAEPKDELQTVVGWNKNSDGTWYYTKSDGKKATGWLMDNNTWYYLNPEGVMQTGWIMDGGNWYYLNISGAMHTGWLKDTNGKWYYLYNNGAMAYNTSIEGYTLDSSGAWIQ